MDASAKSNVDLSNLNISELQELIKRAEAQIKERKVSDQKLALEEITKIANAAGLSLKDLGSLKTASTRKATSPAKMVYQHPDDASKQWSGRGRTPTWVNDHVASGKTRDDLRIK